MGAELTRVGEDQFGWVGAHFEALFNFLLRGDIKPGTMLEHKIQHGMIRVAFDRVKGFHTGQMTPPLGQFCVDCAQVDQIKRDIGIALTCGQSVT